MVAHGVQGRIVAAVEIGAGFWILKRLAGWAGAETRWAGLGQIVHTNAIQPRSSLAEAFVCAVTVT